MDGCARWCRRGTRRPERCRGSAADDPASSGGRRHGATVRSDALAACDEKPAPGGAAYHASSSPVAPGSRTSRAPSGVACGFHSPGAGPSARSRVRNSARRSAQLRRAGAFDPREVDAHPSTSDDPTNVRRSMPASIAGVIRGSERDGGQRGGQLRCVAVIDRSAGKGVIHANQAARRKSRLNARLKAKKLAKA